jgi:hypothetical protein
MSEKEKERKAKVKHPYQVEIWIKYSRIYGKPIIIVTNKRKV